MAPKGGKGTSARNIATMLPEAGVQHRDEEWPALPQTSAPKPSALPPAKAAPSGQLKPAAGSRELPCQGHSSNHPSTSATPVASNGAGHQQHGLPGSSTAASRTSSTGLSSTVQVSPLKQPKSAALHRPLAASAGAAAAVGGSATGGHVTVHYHGQPAGAKLPPSRAAVHPDATVANPTLALQPTAGPSGPPAHAPLPPYTPSPASPSSRQPAQYTPFGGMKDPLGAALQQMTANMHLTTVDRHLPSEDSHLLPPAPPALPSPATMPAVQRQTPWQHAQLPCTAPQQQQPQRQVEWVQQATGADSRASGGEQRIHAVNEQVPLTALHAYSTPAPSPVMILPPRPLRGGLSGSVQGEGPMQEPSTTVHGTPVPVAAKLPPLPHQPAAQAAQQQGKQLAEQSLRQPEKQDASQAALHAAGLPADGRVADKAQAAAGDRDALDPLQLQQHMSQQPQQVQHSPLLDSQLQQQLQQQVASQVQAHRQDYPLWQYVVSHHHHQTHHPHPYQPAHDAWEANAWQPWGQWPVQQPGPAHVMAVGPWGWSAVNWHAWGVTPPPPPPRPPAGPPTSPGPLHDEQIQGSCTASNAQQRSHVTTAEEYVIQSPTVAAIVDSIKAYVKGTPVSKPQSCWLHLVGKSKKAKEPMRVKCFTKRELQEIDAAVAQLVLDPSMMQPVGSKVKQRAQDAITAPARVAEAVPVPEVLQHWLAGAERFHWAVNTIKDIAPLLRHSKLMNTGKDIDFGVRPLVSAVHARRYLEAAQVDVQAVAMSSLADGVEARRLLQKLVIAQSKDDESNVAGFSMQVAPWVARTLTLTNTGSCDMLLLDVIGVPARPGVLSLLDEHGVSLPLLGAKSLGIAGHTNGQAHGRTDRHGCVRLLPSDSYPVTVMLQAVDGPFAEPGIVQQLVLFTLAVEERFLPATCWDDMLPRTTIDKYVVFEHGRLVSAALIRRKQAEAIAACLNVEAKPFIPEALLRLWDTPADTFAAAEDLVLKLLPRHTKDMQSDWSAKEPPFPVAMQSRKAVLLWTAEYGALEHLPVLTQLSRLLLLEELTREQDVRRYDLFHTSLGCAWFDAPKEGQPLGLAARYLLLESCPHTQEELELLTAAPRTIRCCLPCRGVYRGPSLAVLTTKTSQSVPSSAEQLLGQTVQDRSHGAAQGREVLLAVHAPGMPEGRPEVHVGDHVYIRLAAMPQSGTHATHTKPPCEELNPWEPEVVDGCDRVSMLLRRQSTSWVGAASYAEASFQKVEYLGVVATTDATSLPRMLLSMPPKFWTALREQIAKAQANGDSHKVPPPVLAHVRFSFNRSGYVSMLRALRVAQTTVTTHTLVPPFDVQATQLPSCAVVQQTADSMQLYGRTQLNREQRSCAALVCLSTTSKEHTSPVQQLPSCGVCLPPMVLFGPPGTGNQGEPGQFSCSVDRDALMRTHGGKTVTLVETALQVLRTCLGSRLLLTAPANYSCDLLCSALAAAGVCKDEMVRLNDPRRPPAQVKDDVFPYCLLDEGSSTFCLPHPSHMHAKRVVVATCAAAGLLKDGWYVETAAAHFTHVFVDEAGQATVPESLIPLTCLTPSPTCNAVALLAGDPRQLGPVIRSHQALAQGLSKSLLERLMEHYSPQADMWLQQEVHPPLVMLVRNYRSAARLLDLPSRLFYNDALQPAADPEQVKAVYWQELTASSLGQEQLVEADGAAAAQHAGDRAGEQHATDGAPPLESHGVHMLFYGCRGQQMREGDAPSYFNPMEASTVVDLVSGLLNSGAGVTVEDIGVMATYRKQVQRIRMLLRQQGLGQIRVGTVDDYQGQEERVIFISTVLSSPESLPPIMPGVTDSSHATAQDSMPGLGASLSHTAMGGQVNKAGNQRMVDGGVDGLTDANTGFWRNPKRFNVAITRAKALLVVVGHPVVLVEDASWKELLRYCVARGVYKGAGAEIISSLLPYTAEGEAGYPAWEGDNVEGQSADEASLFAAMSHVAEMSLLGLGHAAAMFPSDLDDHTLYSDEQQFRVIL